jgi:hypothetical protein
MITQSLNCLKSRYLPIIFLVTRGFSPRRDGRYQGSRRRGKVRGCARRFWEGDVFVTVECSEVISNAKYATCRHFLVPGQSNLANQLWSLLQSRMPKILNIFGLRDCRKSNILHNAPSNCALGGETRRDTLSMRASHWKRFATVTATAHKYDEEARESFVRADRGKSVRCVNR